MVFRDVSRVAITGVTGIIGQALVRHLLSSDIEVIAFVRPGSPRNDTLPVDARLIKVECDLCSLSLLPSHVIGLLLEKGPVDAFIHLGWLGTSKTNRLDPCMQSENIAYALDAVDLASRLGCKVFVGAGSQAEYGRAEGKIGPYTPTNPDIAYGAAKLCAGHLTRIECQRKGIAHIWVRILSVYGPFDSPDTMVMSTITKLEKNEVPVFTPSEQVWDYLFSGDAAIALLLCAEKGTNGAIYCLGGGNARPLRGYIETIRDLVRPRAQLGIGGVPYSPNQVMMLCADIDNLTEDTGFVPSTSFEDGIGMTVKWLNE